MFVRSKIGMPAAFQSTSEGLCALFEASCAAAFAQGSRAGAVPGALREARATYTSGGCRVVSTCAPGGRLFPRFAAAPFACCGRPCFVYVATYLRTHSLTATCHTYLAS